MVRREQTDNFTDCYPCLTKIDGHNSKSKHTIVYPSIPSALRPIEHDDFLQFPSHLNNGPCKKKNKPAPFQKTNLDFQVPKWSLISRNEIYLIFYRSLNLMI
jgi:hypothetical protein